MQEHYGQAKQVSMFSATPKEEKAEYHQDSSKIPCRFFHFRKVLKLQMLFFICLFIYYLVSCKSKGLDDEGAPWRKCMCTDIKFHVPTSEVKKKIKI